MAEKMWRVQPLYTIVMEILDKKKSMNDMELFESLKTFDKDLGFKELNETLMKMEVIGFISVSSLSKGKRLVQLTKK